LSRRPARRPTHFIRIRTITATTANTIPIARYQNIGEPYPNAPCIANGSDPDQGHGRRQEGCEHQAHDAA
jgi:hypothetical protein